MSNLTTDAFGFHFKKCVGSSASTGKTSSDGEDRYKMDYPSIGTCVIINNKNFQVPYMSTRDGTDVDAAAAERTFSRLGYTVQSFKNQTVHQMKRLLETVSREDHSDRASFVCVMLSHGDEGVICGTDGWVRIQDLTLYFKGSHCPSLVGKPKLFFIQACRGDKSDKGICAVDAAVEDSSEKLPVEADFLYAYSTAPGYFSWRSTSSGSWFIQSLCEMLHDYGRLELMQIMVRVNRMVAFQFEAKGKKQMPCIVMMLTKELYLKQK